MTPKRQHFNVLFLCTGNSARSIMAEALMNRKGFPNFTAYSAGSHPTGRVRAEALKQVASAGIPVDGLRSKSWDEFARPDAPRMHFVFTVCDRAASEVCPVWPGHPLTARWGVPDPAAVEGTREQVERAFFEAFTILDRRITLSYVCPWPPWNKKLSNEKSIASADSSRSLLSDLEFPRVPGRDAHTEYRCLLVPACGIRWSDCI